MENEIFTEAVPSTLAMTFLFSTVRPFSQMGRSGRFANWPNPGEVEIILGDDPYLFYATFAVDRN